MKSTLAFSLLTFAVLSGCAHHNDVRPGVSGVHKVVVKSEDGDQGAREAISQANHYCKESGRSAVFMEEKQKYTGDLDEATYKGAKRATKVAEVVGGSAYVFGGKTESNIGGIVGLGGAAADQAIGEGYTVEMSFQCN